MSTQIKCPQCGKECDASTMVTRKIFFRDSKLVYDSRGRGKYKQFANEKYVKLCSELCGAHHQMGHEG